MLSFGPVAETRTEFLVGTASWTDPTLVKSDLFYPAHLKSAEERLRFYATQFRTVEVDSSYYALASERNAELWRERTPPGFVFNVKAFAWLTQHPADPSRLPKNIKEMLTAAQLRERRRGRPPREALDMAFRMFWSALGPLRETSPEQTASLGMLLFQFPPYFVMNPVNFDYLASLPERMPGASIAVEFRHPSWVAEERARADTMRFLREHRLCYVSIDAPEDKSIVPSFIEATGDQAYVRFHGRNREAWFKRNISAAERYKYLYSERELGDRSKDLKALARRGVKRALVIFNNCYANFGILNAATMQNILKH